MYNLIIFITAIVIFFSLLSIGWEIIKFIGKLVATIIIVATITATITVVIGGIVVAIMN